MTEEVKTMKYLLIRADDLGYSEGVNYGIAAAVAAGLLFCCQVIFLFFLFKVRYFYDIPVSTPQELRPDRAGARQDRKSVV